MVNAYRTGFLFAGVVVLDQVTKYGIRTSVPLGASTTIIPVIFRLVHVENTGAAFGLLQGYAILLAIMSVGVLAFFAYSLWKEEQTSPDAYAWAAIGAGAISNLVDRLLYGSVTDFVSVSAWPAFNVADAAITCGALVLIFHSLHDFSKKDGA